MNNTYGIIKPSLIDIDKDVEIWYNYRPTRNSVDANFTNFVKYPSPGTILSNSQCENDLFNDTNLPGMYNLNLPVDTFGKKGIYTIYIKPKEIKCTIADIGSLASYPDIKGIVLDMNTMKDSVNYTSDCLIGYRVEYLDVNNGNLERQDYYRIITSNQFCEPISQNLTTSHSASKGYRFNENGTLMFITVTPSTSPSFKSNITPYIGAPNQQIILTNTKFDPVMLEIEMVEHDIETLSIMAEGEQVRNLENGRISTYNFNGEIYKQYEFSTIKNNYNQSSVIEAKINKNNNIDFSVDLNEIKNI